MLWLLDNFLDRAGWIGAVSDLQAAVNMHFCIGTVTQLLRKKVPYLPC